MILRIKIPLIRAQKDKRDRKRKEIELTRGGKTVTKYI